MAALILQEVGVEAARPWLVGAVEFDVSGGVVSQSEYESGCMFIGIFDGSSLYMVGAFSLRVVGKTVWIVQAAGRCHGSGLIAAMNGGALNIARRVGASSVAFATVRRGLVEKARGFGFVEAGVMMRRCVDDSQAI